MLRIGEEQLVVDAGHGAHHGAVVIAHGASTARGVKSACVLAHDLARGQIVDKIRERLGPGRAGHFRRRPAG